MQNSAVSLQEIVDSVIASQSGKVAVLLPVLHSIQDRLGHVPKQAVRMIAQALSLSRAEIHGVVGFYQDFRKQPAVE